MAAREIQFENKSEMALPIFVPTITGMFFIAPPFSEGIEPQMLCPIAIIRSRTPTVMSSHLLPVPCPSKPNRSSVDWHRLETLPFFDTATSLNGFLLYNIVFGTAIFEVLFFAVRCQPRMRPKFAWLYPGYRHRCQLADNNR
jgi:hypothetical protein